MLGLFDAKVPRYTSYPSAPYFGAEIDSGHFKSWINAIPPHSKISLYLHIPFCRNLCWFCACRTQGVSSDTPIIDYVTALKQEINLLKAQLPADVCISRLHWGGGTPTILTPEMIADLSSAIADLAPMAADAQFLVEVDPNEFDDARCTALIGAGMTHASIGVQDFAIKTQQTIGRTLDFKTVQSTVETLRSNGVHYLSTDILFGLPHQTHESIITSSNQLLDLLPNRMTVHPYAHAPSQVRRQVMIPSETLPTPENQLDLFRAAKEQILQRGYEQIGISHFVKPDDPLIIARNALTLKRGFQGYYDDPADVLIGLGASAISRFPQGYVQNAPGTARYVADIRQGSFASARGHQFQGEDALRARIIETLLGCFFIPRDTLHAEFPALCDTIDALLTATNEAFPDLLELTPKGLFVPPAARDLVRVIARSLDLYDAKTTQANTPAA